jgi:type I restriction enzyme R subunit
MYDATRTKKEKVSILEDVDFELELIVTDEINVAYILKLLGKYKNATQEEQQKQKEALIKTLSGTVQLRSKRELIEKFINEHLMQLDDTDAIESAFETFWDAEKLKAFDALCEEENLNTDTLKKVIETYIYDERIPLKKDVAETLRIKPKLLEREGILTRVLDKIVLFVEKFYTL